MMRDLQSVSRDPRLRTNSRDASTLTLEHPDNVVVVTSAPRRRFPPLAGEKARFVRLDAAIDFVCGFVHAATAAVVAAAVVDPRGFSIVVDEGVYVDNLSLIPPPSARSSFPENFSLEMIGVKNVVIVGLRFLCIGISRSNFDFSLKNVVLRDQSHLFVEKRDARLNPFVYVDAGARARFVDVAVSAANPPK